MSGLPRIVRDRLGQALPGAAGVDHPDANLLAGFLDHSLTPRERSLVLGHLARCVACREQVSLALPEPDGETAITGFAAARRWPPWLRWPVLRWGLLVASLVIMGTVALVRQPPAPRIELASRMASPPPSRTPLPSDVTIRAALPATSRESPPVKPNRLSKDKESAAPVLALNLEPTQEKAAGQMGKYVLQPQGTLGALQVPRPANAKMAAPMVADALTSPNPIDGGRSNQPASLAVAAAAPPPPPVAPAAAPLQSQSASQPSSSAGAQASNAKSLQASPVGTSSAPPGREKAQSAGGIGVGAAGGVPAQPPELALRAFAPALSARATPPAISAPPPASPSASMSSTSAGADWTISASGKVQRSLDGRKTWEEVNVDKNVVFRVVFAVGPDVWLGGSKGALYHSTDGGWHWTRVTIAADSTTVADDIVHIEFRGAQRGAIQTAGHETWVTSDGGQHWQKQ